MHDPDGVPGLRIGRVHGPIGNFRHKLGSLQIWDQTNGAHPIPNWEAVDISVALRFDPEDKVTCKENKNWQEIKEFKWEETKGSI